MATRTWDSSYESSPAGTDPKSQGDDRIREIKVDVRERANQGGHVWKDANPALDGRHAVNAGGTGVNPHIYKADKTTPLVEFYEAAVQVTANLEVDGDLDVVGGDLYLDVGNLTLNTGALDLSSGSFRHGGQRAWTGPRVITTNYTCTNQDMYIDADTRSGNITLTLQVLSSPLTSITPRVYVVTKRDAANKLSINGPSFCSLGNSGTIGSYTAIPVTPFVIPEGCVGTVTILYDSAINLALVHATLSVAYRTVTSSGNAYWYDHVVWCDASGGAITVTLPDIGSNLAVLHPLTFVAIDTSNTVTIDGYSSQTIDGATTKALKRLTGNYSAITIIPRTTTDWGIISDRYIP